MRAEMVILQVIGLVMLAVHLVEVRRPYPQLSPPSLRRFSTPTMTATPKSPELPTLTPPTLNAECSDADQSVPNLIEPERAEADGSIQPRSDADHERHQEDEVEEGEVEDDEVEEDEDVSKESDLTFKF